MLFVGVCTDLVDDADRAPSGKVEFNVGIGQDRFARNCRCRGQRVLVSRVWVTRIFSVGNMLWMTITVGMLLYQAATQHLYNAKLWDDQVISRQALVIFFVGAALLATARIPREQTAC